MRNGDVKVTANVHSVLDKLAHTVCRVLCGTGDVTQPESLAEAMETHDIGLTCPESHSY